MAKDSNLLRKRLCKKAKAFSTFGHYDNSNKEDEKWSKLKKREEHGQDGQTEEQSAGDEARALDNKDQRAESDAAPERRKESGEQSRKRTVLGKKPIATKQIMRNVRGQMIPITVPANYRSPVKRNYQTLPYAIRKKMRFPEKTGRCGLPRKRRSFLSDDDDKPEYAP